MARTRRERMSSRIDIRWGTRYTCVCGCGSCVGHNPYTHIQKVTTKFNLGCISCRLPVPLLEKATEELWWWLSVSKVLRSQLRDGKNKVKKNFLIRQPRFREQGAKKHGATLRSREKNGDHAEGGQKIKEPRYTFLLIFSLQENYGLLRYSLSLYKFIFPIGQLFKIPKLIGLTWAWVPAYA